MAQAHLRLAEPSGEVWNRTTPTRKTNKELRTREYVREDEVALLIKAVASNPYAHRDTMLIRTSYRHGLRASEAIDLKWDQVDWKRSELHVKRLKGGVDSVHEIQGDELRALRRLREEQQPASCYVFTSRRSGPLTRSSLAKMIEKAGKGAGIERCHFHQLRHGCGFKLINDGFSLRHVQQWLGHSDVKHTARYALLSSKAFASMKWK